MKKIVIALALFIAFCIQPYGFEHIFAETDYEYYKIYSTENVFLAEKESPQVGDQIILPSLQKYEIVSVDQTAKTAIAKNIGYFIVDTTSWGAPSGDLKFKNAIVGLYSTHNDESYELGDGYSTVYAAGGIHDVAKKLRDEFLSLGVGTVLDETLHIPHDSGAYARSGATVDRILNEYGPNAIFDIHRDGVQRSTYFTTDNGTSHSKVRIVVGKASANFQTAQSLAVMLLAKGNQMYPWLFLDIYLASGHYNQGKSKTALLFEMGTYKIEKDFVLDSCKPLAETIAVSLFEADTSSSSLPSTNITIPNDPSLSAKNANLTSVIVGSVSFLFCIASIILFLKPKKKRVRAK